MLKKVQGADLDQFKGLLEHNVPVDCIVNPYSVGPCHHDGSG